MKFQMRLWQLLIAFDQFVHCFLMLVHPRGAWADESLSARAWREGAHSKNWDRVRKALDLIFFWDKDHCQNSYASEMNRLQLAPEYREDG
jgi:hypothetical protein